MWQICETFPLQTPSCLPVDVSQPSFGAQQQNSVTAGNIPHNKSIITETPLISYDLYSGDLGPAVYLLIFTFCVYLFMYLALISWTLSSDGERQPLHNLIHLYANRNGNWGPIKDLYGWQAHIHTYLLSIWRDTHKHTDYGMCWYLLGRERLQQEGN